MAFVSKYIGAGVAVVLTSFLILDLHMLLLTKSETKKTALPIFLSTSESPCYVSPFCEINVKSLMLDPANTYIHNILARWTNQLADFSNEYDFISANDISLSHVPVAMVAGMFISQDSLFQRRIGVFIFEIRNFLDAFDGVVAVARRRKSISTLNLHPNQSALRAAETLVETSSKSGYYLDGVCDGIGVTLMLIGCFLYLQRHPIGIPKFYHSLLPSATNGRKYFKGSSNDLVDMENNSRFGPRNYFITRMKRPGFLLVTFAVQMILLSIMWNRYIAAYSNILENSTLEGNRLEFQDQEVKINILHGFMTWVVFFIWRYANPHAILEALLMGIFVDMMGEFLVFIVYSGFILIFVTFFFSQAHLYTIS